MALFETLCRSGNEIVSLEFTKHQKDLRHKRLFSQKEKCPTAKCIEKKVYRKKFGEQRRAKLLALHFIVYDRDFYC